MRKAFLFHFFLFMTLNLFAQKGNNKLISEYEDTLKVMAYEIMNADSEEKRELANNAFIQNLNEVLKYEKSFNFPFDSLTTIARIKSPDNKFRIFNWLLKKDNGTYKYYGIVHSYNKRRKKYELIPLIDNSENIRNPEQASLDAKNWYGGIVYDIVLMKKNGIKYYTLFLWDGNDKYSTRKIIDIMYFSGKNKLKFGLAVFKKNKKQSKKRVIIEYDSKTSVSVKYHERTQQIIFNNLVPIKKDLEGLYEYYIPEGTFNAYNYKQGKWWLEENVDVRNNERSKKFKNPKTGLFSR